MDGFCRFVHVIAIGNSDAIAYSDAERITNCDCEFDCDRNGDLNVNSHTNGNSNSGSVSDGDACFQPHGFGDSNSYAFFYCLYIRPKASSVRLRVANVDQD